jgi:geranylgeranyl reductase family protein
MYHGPIDGGRGPRLYVGGEQRHVSRSDVVIVGAGPSGAWLAFLLAKRGARVAIIDGSHPREKPCGGGVTARALTLVRDAIAASELRAVNVREARFVSAATGASVSVPLEAGDGSLIVASRRDFDGLLLSAACRAGARLIASRAAALTRDRNNWSIETADGERLAADTLVGADGANSLVRRRLTRPFRRDQLSIATGFFAHGVSTDEILIELTADPPGYIWSFPRPDHLAIGICAQADFAVTAAALRGRIASWIARLKMCQGAMLQPYSWPIPSLPKGDLDALEIAGHGWITVGDAAGLVDPITREGIFFALQSADFAAEALSANLHTRFAPSFQERVREEIGSELARAARFKAGFFQPRFIRLMQDALAESARIRRVMADLIAGRQAYRTLEWRLARTLEIGLAWRLLTGKSTRPAPARSAG